MKDECCFGLRQLTDIYFSSKVVVLTHKSPCADSEFWSVLVSKVVNKVSSVHLHVCMSMLLIPSTSYLMVLPGHHLVCYVLML